MKTIINKKGLTLSWMLLFIFSISISLSAQNKSYFEINGKIVDAKTNKRLVYATITVEGENTATISNEDGEFQLKIDNASNAKNIIISYLGYKDLTYPISNFGKKMITIKLEPTIINLSEVVVSPKTPKELLLAALKKIPKNYSSEPNQMTAFFREYIKKRKNYVSLAEAVLDVYKSSYTNMATYDQTKILKGRKGTDKRRLDTLLFKVQGGPATILMLDIAKDPKTLFEENELDYYEFTMEPPVTLYDRTNYVVKFTQKYVSEYPLFNGKIFIDTESLAISGAELDLNIIDEAKASSIFLRKKPAGLKLYVEKASYKVMYKYQDGKWYFNYASGNNEFRIKWDKKLFSTKYATTFEIAITDRSKNMAQKIKSKERFKKSDFFTEKVQDFYDEDFWGKYNTIKPDESIESAIKRLKRVNK